MSKDYRELATLLKELAEDSERNENDNPLTPEALARLRSKVSPVQLAGLLGWEVHRELYCFTHASIPGQLCDEGCDFGERGMIRHYFYTE